MSEWISVDDRLPDRVDKYPVIRFLNEDDGWYGRDFAPFDGNNFIANGKVLFWIDAPMPSLPEPEA